nr:uncharacterized protein LOC109774690 [Aegilops tauschii subsp. strangulata]
MMESESPPPASSPTAVDNTEVSSQRTLPEQGEVPETAKTVPKADTSASKSMGEPTPMETGDGGQVQFGPQPNVIPETYTVPEIEEQPSLPEGGAPTTPASSINAEAPDTLVRALQSTIIVEEHLTLMADTSEVKALKSALAEAKKEAEEERASRLKHELRVEEVQQELKDAIGKCESLECKSSEQNFELSKALQSAQEARDEAQSAVWEIQEAKQIAAVNPADQDQHNAAVAKLRDEIAQAKEELNAENARMAKERASLYAQAQWIQSESYRLMLDQNASNDVMRRRHRSHLPPVYEKKGIIWNLQRRQCKCIGVLKGICNDEDMF